MSKNSRRLLHKTVAFIAAALLIPIPAHADNTVIDGDGVVPVVSNTLSFGNVCQGTTVNKTVLIGISKQGTGTNVFANSSTATLSIGTITGANLTADAPSPNTIAIPANWSAATNGTIAGSLSSKVTFVANTLGSFSGSIVYNASGTNASSSSITRPGTLNVSATVVTCDTTGPTINVPSDITAEATGSAGAVVNYSVTASDANPAHPNVTCSPASGSTFAIGTITVNCTSTDAANNTSSASFKITVQDTTPPNISGTPSNLTVEATSGSGATVSYVSPSATDIVDGTTAVTCSPASGSTFALGTNTVVCTTTDAHQNSASSSFNITIDDTTKPILSLPANITEEATGPSGAPVSYSASATDIVDGAIVPNCTPASGSTFAIATASVNCSATDAHSNTATGSFNVTVQDTTAPSLGLPTLSPVEATGPTGAAVSFAVTANDVVDDDLSANVTCDKTSGSTFALGSTAINCSVTDAHGNTASGQFDVMVQDTTAPDLTVPADQLVEATGPSGAVATFSASATDLVDTSVTVVCDAISGSTFPLGTTTVKCTATDDSGNKATSQFTIKVEDSTAPAITVPANFAVEATGPSGAMATYSASALDLVDGAVTPSCTPASGSTFALATTTVTCTATDIAGNSASKSFQVTVQDTTAPAVTVPSDIVAEATGPTGAIVNYSGASANDVVDGALAVTCTPASGSIYAIAETTVTCSATDAAGNTGTNDFKVTVQDTTAPSVSCGAASSAWLATDASIACTASDAGSGLAANNPSNFSLVTNVSVGTETNNATTGSRQICDLSGNCTPAGPIAGNKIDKKAPANISFVGGPVNGGVYYFGSVPAAPTCTATDGGSGLASCNVSGYSAAIGPQTMVATAKDAVNNTGTAQSSYTVNNWTLSGFYQPTDMGNVVNTVKNGSTVPLKFEVFAGSTELTNATLGVVVSSLTYKAESCSALPVDDVEVLATGNTTLRYDTTAGQYIYNWKTPSTAGACLLVTMTTVDGSKISAHFKLK